MRLIIEVEKIKPGTWSVEVRGYRHTELILYVATTRDKGFDDAWQWAQDQIKEVRVE